MTVQSTASVGEDATAPAVRSSPRWHSRDPMDRLAISFLVKAAADGDQGAWDALVEAFAPTVWAIARGHRLSFTDAADVFQTTWLRLTQHLDTIEQPERVGAWLATTARRECLRVVRLGRPQESGGPDFEVEADPITPAASDTDVVAHERMRVVNRVVEDLPVRSQVLLRLLSVDSPLSYRDISEALSMPIGSIGPTRARALERVRRFAVAEGISL
jgi:RNA polymerase sigma factor (sigma-70 family)